MPKPRSVNVNSATIEMRDLALGQGIQFKTKTPGFSVIQPEVKYLPELLFLGLRRRHDLGDESGPIGIALLANYELVQLISSQEIWGAVISLLDGNYVLDWGCQCSAAEAVGERFLEWHQKDLGGIAQRLTGITRVEFPTSKPIDWTFSAVAQPTGQMEYSFSYRSVNPTTLV